MPAAKTPSSIARRFDCFEFFEMSYTRPMPSSKSFSSEPLLQVSLRTHAVLDIVERHVALDIRTRRAIERDLAAALGPGAVAPVTTPGAGDVLTTEEAAQLLGVSRPHVVKLIDSGVLELHQRVGNQRRVLRSVVMRYRAGERQRQARALRRLGDDFDEELSAS